ncbi:MAG: HNH endonuclease [Acidimicrobiia bacterium]|nr:HNH endonuclease [Acidimicrobiia bacterium]
MPCASPTTLTPNRSIVPRKGQLFEIDVGLLREQKQCESSGRSTRTPRHPCATIVHMFVADDISPVESAIPASVYRPSADVSRVVAPCRPSREPLSIWATVTWRFDIAVGHSSVGRGVHAAVQELTDDLSHLTTGSDLGRILTELELLARAVEAATISVLARADRTEAFRDDGHGTLTGWARSLIKWSPSEASARARTALASHEYPQLVERLRGGTLGIAQSRRLASLHANRRVRDELPIVFDTLADIAGALPYEDFNTAVLRWEQLADADGAHRHADVVHDNRDAGVHPVGDTVYVDAHVGTAQGALILEVFERYVEAELRHDLAARDALGLTTLSDLPRTAAQRRADALHAIFCSAATGSSPAPDPVVNILIDADTYETALRAMENDERLPSLARRPDDIHHRRCETTSGLMLDPIDVVGASLVGHVRRVVIGADRTVIDLGRKSRLFTGAAREAVWLRRRRCVWPSCSRMHCEVDHRIPWSEGGRTSPDNGDPLCAKHNRWKTRGYRTHMNPHTKAIDVMRPDGSIISPV